MAREIGRWAKETFRRDPEKVREIMRRLLWSLNEESGGIGWGSPLAMAEVILEVEEMAEEYTPLLLSFIHPRGNPLEFHPLFLEALEGVAKVAEGRPELLEAHGAREVLEGLMADPERAELASRALKGLTKRRPRR